MSYTYVVYEQHHCTLASFQSSLSRGRKITMSNENLGGGQEQGYLHVR